MFITAAWNISYLTVGSTVNETDRTSLIVASSTFNPITIGVFSHPPGGFFSKQLKNSCH